MAKKSFSYAQYEGLRQEMLANDQLCHWWEYAYPSAVGPTGEVIDLGVEFGRPRTSGLGWAIDEMWILGAAMGAAIAGVPSVIRLPSMTSVFCAEYIFNQGTKLRHMTGGQGSCPVVIWQDGAGRGYGRAGGSAGQHTDVGQEAVYANMAGLQIVLPSNSYNAKGLLISAIRAGDPILYMGYSGVRARESEDVPDEAYEYPIGKGELVAEGDDLTIVAWAPAIANCDGALGQINELGISADLIDLVSIKPLDTELLFSSVDKTGRVLVVTHASYTGSFASHVVAEIAQQFQGVPIKIIAFPDAPGPFASTMMSWMVPEADKIVLAARQMFDQKYFGGLHID